MICEIVLSALMLLLLLLNSFHHSGAMLSWLSVHSLEFRYCTVHNKNTIGEEGNGNQSHENSLLFSYLYFRI